MRRNKILKYLLLGFIAAVVATFLIPSRQKPGRTPRDYAEIAAEGILRATTEYNTLSFHVDGDTVSGFNYELIEAFARDHHLRLSLSPQMSHEQRLQGLAEGTYDIIATDILATSELKDSLLLTIPIVLNKQILVQRKPQTKEDSARFVRSQLDLAGRTLNVIKGSPILSRIHHLASEIGDTIYIHEIEKYGSEQLIALVAHGEIDYAVCNESIAKALADSFPQIDIQTAISFTQFYSWGVSKHSPALLDTLDTWLERFKPTKEFQKIYRRYYPARR